MPKANLSLSPATFFLVLGFWLVSVGPLGAELSPQERQLARRARVEVRAARGELAGAQDRSDEWQARSQFYEKSVGDYATKAETVQAQRDHAYQVNAELTAKLNAANRLIHHLEAIGAGLILLALLFIVRPWRAAFLAIPYLALVLWGLFVCGGAGTLVWWLL